MNSWPAKITIETVKSIFFQTLISAIFFTFFLLLANAGEANSQQNGKCLRCHGMKTLGYQDTATGNLRNLSIDLHALAKSDHAGLACLDCHSAGFAAYPHFSEARNEQLECLSCHKNSEKFPRKMFEAVERSFTRSNHYQSAPQALTCFSCHDPHTFSTLNGKSDAGVKSHVKRDNDICLGCHEKSKPLDNMSSGGAGDLLKKHVWLPGVNRHLQSVRCVECHTQGDSERSHFILGGEYAVKECVACHSRDSILTSKLYRYRAHEERNKVGFIHSVVMNDAYIIGMTRNQWLDWGGIGLVILTLVGVGGHGLGRWIARRKGQKL
ncbi:MAG: cytochrome c3 family protein [Magnetococcales bacterium]|nr:cytochrome c3 family protein [Magnetococcales bacterium]